jgi:hypothetical protein
MSWSSYWSFPSVFPTKFMYAFPFPPCMLQALSIPCTLIWLFCLYFVKSTNYEAAHYAVFFNLLLLHPCSGILGTLFPDTFSLSPYCHSWSVTPIQSYRKSCSFLYFSFFFLDGRQEDKRFWSEWWQAVHDFSQFLNSFLLNWNFEVWLFPRYLKFATFLADLLTFFILWFCLALRWKDINICLIYPLYF